MSDIVKYQSALTRFQPTTLDEIITLSKLFAESGLFNVDNQRQSAAQLAVKIMAGQELGFTPFASANGMQIIKGKCAPGANLMAALVKASGRYNYRVSEMTDTKVSIDFFENGKPIGTSTFTQADANKAGTQNMGKFPRNMLFARAISNGVKWFCADLANGVAMYTPEELGATVDYETGEIITMPETPAAPLPQLKAPEPEAPKQDNPFADAPPVTIPDDAAAFAADLVASFRSPLDAQAWAVENKYTDNEHSARTRWVTIVKEQFDGKYTPSKFTDIAAAYVAHYLVKQAAPVAA